MSKWTPVLESDTDTGEHTCYSRQVNEKEYIWLSRNPGGTWNVEVRNEADGDFITIAKSKTLRGAKQRALRLIKDILQSS